MKYKPKMGFLSVPKLVPQLIFKVSILRVIAGSDSTSTRQGEDKKVMRSWGEGWGVIIRGRQLIKGWLLFEEIG